MKFDNKRSSIALCLGLKMSGLLHGRSLGTLIITIMAQFSIAVLWDIWDLILESNAVKLNLLTGLVAFSRVEPTKCQCSWFIFSIMFPFYYFDFRKSSSDICRWWGKIYCKHLWCQNTIWRWV